MPPGADVRTPWILACALLLAADAHAQAPPRIGADDAAAHVGETLAVCGVVAQTYCSADRGTRLTLETRPGTPPFFVRIALADRAKFGSRPEDRLYRQRVCVNGTIEKRRVAATMDLADPAALTIDPSSVPVKPFAPDVLGLCDVPEATRPRVLHQERAEYPKKVRDRGAVGTVSLQAVVETSGKVGAIRVTKSIDADLDAAAVKALKKWTFAPAVLDGTAVPVVVTVQMGFALRR
ncbi:MAG: energy transducer TonB [Vicinamibacterales bacterium]